MVDLNAYFYYSELMVSKLEDKKDQIKAGAWLEKLKDSTCGNLQQRFVYLKMLYLALKTKKLFPPFNMKLSNCSKLFQLPDEISQNIFSLKDIELFIDFHRFQMNEKNSYLFDDIKIIPTKLDSGYSTNDFTNLANNMEIHQTQIRIRGGGVPNKNTDPKGPKATTNTNNNNNSVKDNNKKIEDKKPPEDASKSLDNNKSLADKKTSEDASKSSVKIDSHISGTIRRHRAGSNSKKSFKTKVKRKKKSLISPPECKDKSTISQKTDKVSDTKSSTCAPKCNCPGLRGLRCISPISSQVATPGYPDSPAFIALPQDEIIIPWEPSPPIISSRPNASSENRYPDSPAFTALPDVGSPMTSAWDPLESSPQLPGQRDFQSSPSQQRSMVDRQSRTKVSSTQESSDSTAYTVLSDASDPIVLSRGQPSPQLYDQRVYQSPASTIGSPLYTSTPVSVRRSTFDGRSRLINPNLSSTQDSPAFVELPESSGPPILAWDQLKSSPQLPGQRVSQLPTSSAYSASPSVQQRSTLERQRIMTPKLYATQQSLDSPAFLELPESSGPPILPWDQLKSSPQLPRQRVSQLPASSFYSASPTSQQRRTLERRRTVSPKSYVTQESFDSPAFVVLPDSSGPMTLAWDQIGSSSSGQRVYQPSTPTATRPVHSPRVVAQQRSTFGQRGAINSQLSSTPLSPDSPAFEVIPNSSGTMTLAWDQLGLISSPDRRPSPSFLQQATRPVYSPRVVAQQRSTSDQRGAMNPQLSSTPLSPDSPAFEVIPNSSGTMTLAWDQLGLISSPDRRPSPSLIQQELYSSPQAQSVHPSSARSPAIKVIKYSKVSTHGNQNLSLPVARQVVTQVPRYYSVGPTFAGTQQSYDGRGQPLQTTQVSTRSERARTPTQLPPHLLQSAEWSLPPESPDSSLGSYPNASTFIISARAKTRDQIPSHLLQADSSLLQESPRLLSTYPSISQLSDSVFLPTSIPADSTPEQVDNRMDSIRRPRSLPDLPSDYGTFTADIGLSSTLINNEPQRITYAMGTSDPYAEIDSLTMSSMEKPPPPYESRRGLNFDCACRCPCTSGFLDNEREDADCQKFCNYDVGTGRCAEMTPEENASFRERAVAGKINTYKDSVRICDNIEHCSGSSKRCREDIICRLASGGFIDESTESDEGVFEEVSETSLEDVSTVSLLDEEIYPI